MAKRIIAIDIGNKFAYASVIIDDPAKDPEPLFPAQLNLHNQGMPTDAYVEPPDGKNIEVYDSTVKMAPASQTHRRHPENIVHAVKRKLTSGSVSLSGITAPIPVERIYAADVRDLLVIANQRLASAGLEPVYEVVFTYPASFLEDVKLLDRMQKSIESVTIDGHPIQVRGRLSEPAAAAIDYMHFMQNGASPDIRIPSENHCIMVLDFGHGTFDLAVLKSIKGDEPYQLLYKDGLSEVGGLNFDKVLFDEICRILSEEYHYQPGSEIARSAIRDIAADMKHKLTDNKTDVQQVQIADGSYVDITVTSERFEKISSYFLNQVLECTQRGLDYVSQNNIPINSIVLTGGASQMPMVKEGVKRLTGGTIPITVYRPSQAISFGAARYAWGIANSDSKRESNPVMEQSTDYSYGIYTVSDDEGSGIVRYLVKSNTKLPCHSEGLCVTAPASGRMGVNIFCSVRKLSEKDSDSVLNCRQIINIPFNVKPSSECVITLDIGENYDIGVECVSDGRKIHKQMSDPFKKLYE